MTNTVWAANTLFAGAVSAIDGKTRTVTTVIPVGTGAQGVAVNPVTNTVYVADEGSKAVSVISGKSDAGTATVAVGTDPRGVAVNPLTNTAYVTNNGGRTVSVISGAHHG